jgi:hypothetical protein
LYNTERLHEPINLASFVYVLSAALAIGVLAIRRLRSVPFAWLLVIASVTVLAAKAALGYSIVGLALPLTVTEICAVAVTVWFARRIAESTYDFEKSAKDLMALHLNEQLCRFDVAQAELYREVRRARQFERPLAMVSLEPTQASLDVSVCRFLEEVQRETIQKYVQARMTRVMAQQTEESGIIAHRGNHFVVLLPEADRERAEEVLARIHDAVGRELGLELRAGVATFPDEELTLSGLLERSEDQMAADWQDLQPSEVAPHLEIAEVARSA